MKILQVSPYSWSARGGVQAHIRQLSQTLARRGHEVRILSPDHHTGRRAITVDLPTEGVPAGAVTLTTFGPCRRIPFNGSRAPVCMRFSVAGLVRATLAGFQPDRVHVHEPLVPSASLGAAWYSEAPVVATFHTYCPPSLGRVVYGTMAWVLERSLRRLAARIAVSEAAASCSQANLPGPFLIIPNGVDVERFAGVAAPRNGRTLLFVNRLDVRKGFDVALTAFSRLAAADPRVRLVVVGTGQRRGAVDALAPGVRERVVMLGDVADRDLPGVYAAADVFLAPALGQESFGVVLLEAMAAGLPIVASDIEGYREVVRDDIEGLLVPPGDAERLAAAAGRLLRDRGLADRLGAAGRERASAYSWSSIAERLERIYATAEPPLAGDTGWLPWLFMGFPLTPAFDEETRRL